MAELEIYVTDVSGEIVSQIDDFQKLSVTKKFNDVGAWSLDLRTDTKPTAYFTPGAGIVIKRNGDELISGPMTNLHRTKGGQGNASNDRLAISGNDYNLLLNQRLAWPCNADHYSPFVTQEFRFPYSENDVIEAAAEVAMKHYVEKNMTANAWDATLPALGLNTAQFRGNGNYYWPGKNVSRSIPNLSIATNQNRGWSLKVSARLVRLLILLQGIARSGGGLGFSINRLEHGPLEFDVYQPADRSNYAIFSEEQGNMLGFDYSLAMPTTTYAMVGGDDEGTARVFYEWWRYGYGPYEPVPVGTAPNFPAATWGRIESDIVDGKDDEKPPFDDAYKQLSMGQTSAISFTLQESKNVQYGKSLFLGDLVTADVDGFKIRNSLSSAQFDYAPGQVEAITMVIGDSEAKSPLIPNFFSKQKKLSIEIAQLQAR